MPPIKFRLIQLTIWEEMSTEEFQDGRYLGYLNSTILAVLNLYVTPMHPTKFLLNLTYGLGEDLFEKFQDSPGTRADNPQGTKF